MRRAEAIIAVLLIALTVVDVFFRHWPVFPL